MDEYKSVGQEQEQPNPKYYWDKNDSLLLVQALQATGLEREQMFRKITPTLKKLVAAIYYGHNYRETLEKHEPASVHKNDLLSHLIEKLLEFNLDPNSNIFGYVSKIVINHMQNITRLTESLQIENKDIYRKKRNIYRIDDFPGVDVYKRTPTDTDPLYEFEDETKVLALYFTTQLNKQIKKRKLITTTCALKLNEIEQAYLLGATEFFLQFENYMDYDLTDINDYIIRHFPVVTYRDLRRLSWKYFKSFKGEVELKKKYKKH